MLSAFFLGAFAFAPASGCCEAPAVLQILADGGGTLGERQEVIGWMKRTGIRVEVRGTCASACLWALTLPKDQVCFSPEAGVGNHTHIGEPDDAVAWTRGAKWIADGWAKCTIVRIDR